MAKTTTDRLKMNPPLGRMPTLQFVLPQELQIDDTYQRSIEAADSQKLILQIARYWDWDLCQPLMVSRRGDGSLYVIDGQHRLAAARLRGDIAQLPAMVKEYASAADEAASFVHLNQRRRPLTPLQIFRAAVTSGDSQAQAIMAAIEAAGLRLGKSSQLNSSPPGTINNVGGLQMCWQRMGANQTRRALHILSRAFAGQQLLYAGTIFPGIARVVADNADKNGMIGQDLADGLEAMLSLRAQVDWRNSVLHAKADNVNLNLATAAALTIRSAWSRFKVHRAERSAPVPPAPRPAAPRIVPAPARSAPARVNAFNLEGGKGWCDQCEARKSRDQVHACASAFCSLKDALAA